MSDESFIKRVENLLTGAEHMAADDMVAEGGPVAADDTDDLPADPPPGWTVPEPPTEPDEEELLTEAFGEPENGVYAPGGDS